MWGLTIISLKSEAIMMTKMATRRQILSGFAIVCMTSLGPPARVLAALNLVIKGNTVLPPSDNDVAAQSGHDRVVKKATREAYSLTKRVTRLRGMICNDLGLRLRAVSAQNEICKQTQNLERGE
jgi:DNA-binding NarL/FixJ family response regulator